MKVGPVTFLALVAGAWVLVRAVMLWPDRTVPHVKPRIAWHPPVAGWPIYKPVKQAAAGGIAPPTPAWLSLSKPVSSASVNRKEGLRQAQPSRYLREIPRAVVVDAAPMVGEVLDKPAPVASRSKLTLSTWAILRTDASPALATAGQLGGSQAGIRARYPLTSSVHAAARLSAPIGSSRGKEAAIGLDWQPVRAVPVTLTAERRIGLDRGGRDAFAVGAFGGFDRTVGAVRLEVYAQAGIVGARRRDAYVDGSVRADVPVTRGIAFGVGAWGGAQPGVSRVDVGPQLVVRMHRMRIGAEWRARVAGNARPGSGPAVSLGADF